MEVRIIMNNIIIVTNESSIVDSTLKQLYNNPEYVKVENVPYTEGNPYARWIEIEDGEATEMCAVPSENNTYNVLRIPMAGFVYMVAHARYYNRMHDKNMVVCMKELYPTMLFALEKYHMFLYGKSKVTERDFEEWFNIPQEDETNSLITSEYDDIIDMALEGKFPMVSEALADIL
jgi:hypothetical protein